MRRRAALIVDDERIARRELRYLLREHPEIDVVGEAASVEQAVEAIARLQPDVIFLDVQMPGASAFDLFDRTNVEAGVIFVTAYDEFALRAFEVNALDYLTKPVRPERLRQAIERCLERLPGAASRTGRLALSDSILVTAGRTPRFIKVVSIDCILAEGDYTRLVAGGNPVGLVLKPIKEWDRILPEKAFFRISRSTIINCERAVCFEPIPSGGYEVCLKHLESPLTMSRRFARRFRTRFEP